jgi:tRNA-specific 2-thiouridylase
MSKKGKVLVAMSGGIDSSVAAVLLHEQGYDLVGITMKTWDYASSGGSKKETGCCSLDSINDAREVAVRLGFPHYVLDIREEFGETVIDNFVEEYLAGRTPNPCVLCNTYIKWDALLKRAEKLGCDYIATGHYANKRYENGRYIISKGIDHQKDQSYVLWGLSQSALQKTIFPMGQFKKDNIRQMAKEMGFHNLVNKSESYEICFIPDNDYRTFLKHRKPEISEKLKNGNFVLSDGTIVGKHEGYPFYTIGQRKGLVAMGEPYYVINIIPESNTVVIGKKEELLQNYTRVRGLNLIKYDNLFEETFSITKIRYKHEGAGATVKQIDVEHAEVIFHEPVEAITPGQSAVFYEGDDVLGGGWIMKT